MTARPDVREKPRRWWVRAARWLAGAFLASLVSFGVYFAVADHRAQRAMEAALEELDAREPGWRLAEIEAARAVVPPGENSAPLIVAAAAQLPPDWPAMQELADEAQKYQPNEQLTDDLARRLAGVLDGEGAAALRTSRGLSDRPRGRHRLIYDRNMLQTQLNDQQQARVVGALWRLESLRQAHAGDGPAALRAARSVLHAGRSLGDEPLAITQLIRTALAVIAAQAVERALAQSSPVAGELTSWQELARDEDAVPVYRIAARGERALWHHMLASLASGEVEMWEFADLKERRLEDRLFGWVGRHRSRAAIPEALRLHDRVIQAAEAPPWLQADLEEQIDRDKQALPSSASLVKLAVPPAATLGESYRRKQATLRGLAAALALERYRLAHGRWPAGLGDLVPAFLAAVPTDPYDGAPLRYVLTEDGAMVYSVGADRQDDGGRRCDNPIQTGCDLPFRLYNPDRRRQPPLPKKEADDDEGP